MERRFELGLVGLDANFEFMVNKAAKGQRGQWFAPRFAIAELVSIIAPQLAERLAYGESPRLDAARHGVLGKSVVGVVVGYLLLWRDGRQRADAAT